MRDRQRGAHDRHRGGGSTCRRWEGAGPVPAVGRVPERQARRRPRSIPRRSVWTTDVNDGASASKAAFARRGLIPAHSANESAVPGPKTCRYRRASSTRASTGSTSGRGTVQTVGAAGTVPADQDRARRRGIAECAGVNAHPTSRRAVVHRPPGEELVEASGRVFGSPQRLGVVGQPPEREHGPIPRRDDVGAESRSPQLHQRRVLPGGRCGPLDAGVDRQHRGSGHAVLQSRPRRPSERLGSRWEPLVECPHPPPERENLRPGEDETRPHLTNLAARRSTQAR